MSGNDFAFKRDVIRRAINSGVITNRGIFFEDIIKAANDSKFAASKSNELYDNLDKQKSVKIQNNDTEWKEIRNDNIKIRRSRIYNVNKQNNGVKRRIRSARIQSIKKHNKKMQDIIRRIKRRQLLRIQNGNAMVMQKF
jgi:hypothetical protein